MLAISAERDNNDVERKIHSITRVSLFQSCPYVVFATTAYGGIPSI